MLPANFLKAFRHLSQAEAGGGARLARWRLPLAAEGVRGTRLHRAGVRADLVTRTSGIYVYFLNNVAKLEWVYVYLLENPDKQEWVGVYFLKKFLN